MQYETRDGQTIYDIALQTVGLENIYSFIRANSEITDINFSFDNKNLSTTFIPPPPVSPPELMAKITVAVTTKSIIGREGQSLFDITLMTTNDLGSIVQFSRDNNISNVNQTALLGKSFTFEIDSIKDISIYNYMVQKSTVISTIDPKIISGKSFDKSFDKSFL